MGTGRRQVIWSAQAASALDEAIGYISADSPSAAIKLLETALDVGASLSVHAERGRVVPEVGSSNVRELFVFKYRLMYELTPDQVQIIAFVHGARDFARWQAEQQRDHE